MPPTKSRLRIYQESEEDIYTIRKGMMLGVQIYLGTIIVLYLTDIPLDYVVMLVPRGVS